MKFSDEVMPGDTTRWCVLLFASLVLGSASGGAACERGRSWWDRQLGVCQPCTRCDPGLRLAVKLPCQVHRDTVCQSLNDVKIFPFNTPLQKNATTEPTISVSDFEYYEYVDYVEPSDNDASDFWDVQPWTLTLAASGCVVFFGVVLCMSFYHAKQWRILKQALKSDVRDLSAKLKLMEAGPEPPAERVIPADHHIYCNVHVAKDGLLGPSTDKKGLGNVYTQEKH